MKDPIERLPDPPIDVRKIRGLTNLSEDEFCLYFGFRLKNLKAWESKEESPKGHERTFLLLIEAMPADCLQFARELQASDEAFMRSHGFGEVVPFRRK